MPKVSFHVEKYNSSYHCWSITSIDIRYCLPVLWYKYITTLKRYTKKKTRVSTIDWFYQHFCALLLHAWSDRNSNNFSYQLNRDVKLAGGCATLRNQSYNDFQFAPEKDWQFCVVHAEFATNLNVKRCLLKTRRWTTDHTKFYSTSLHPCVSIVQYVATSPKS